MFDVGRSMFNVYQLIISIKLAALPWRVNFSASGPPSEHLNTETFIKKRITKCTFRMLF